jgi:thiamine-monophosphate kinase
MAGSEGVHAAIDISDGLSSEAWHLALDSGVSLCLEAEHIPLHPALTRFMAWFGPDGGEGEAAEFALDSGEEFELLLTLEPGHPALSGSDPEPGVPLTVIGRVEAGNPAVTLEAGGESRAVAPGGWSHRGP